MPKFQGSSLFPSELMFLLTCTNENDAIDKEDIENLIKYLVKNKISLTPKHLKSFANFCRAYEIDTQDFYKNIFVMEDSNDQAAIGIKVIEKTNLTLNPVVEYPQINLSANKFKNFCYLLRIYPEIKEPDERKQTIDKIHDISKIFFNSTAFTDLKKDERAQLVGILFNSAYLCNLSGFYSIQRLVDLNFTQAGYFSNQIFCDGLIRYINKTANEEDMQYVQYIPIKFLRKFFNNNITKYPDNYSKPLTTCIKHLLEVQEPKKLLQSTLDYGLRASIFFGLSNSRNTFSSGGNIYLSYNKSLIRCFLLNVFLRSSNNQAMVDLAAKDINIINRWLNKIYTKLNYNGTANAIEDLNAKAFYDAIYNSQLYQQIIANQDLQNLLTEDTRYKNSAISKYCKNHYNKAIITSKVLMGLSVPLLIGAIISVAYTIVLRIPSNNLRLTNKILCATSLVLMASAASLHQVNEGMHNLQMIENNLREQLVAEKFVSLAYQEFQR